MGSNRGHFDKKVTELTNKTKMKKPVVQSLVHHYLKHCKDKGMDRESVRECLMHQFDMLDDFLLDRIFRTFDITANAQHLKLDDFVTGMGIFLTSSLQDKIKFCFGVYDVNRDGFITREDMYPFLKNSMVTKPHDPDDDHEEHIKDLMELALKQLDADHDGRVSMSDFQTSVSQEKLLLEAFGKCLPDEQARCEYLYELGDSDMAPAVATMSSSRSRSTSKRRNAKSPRRHQHQPRLSVK